MRFKLKIIYYLIGFKITRWFRSDLSRLQSKRFSKLKKHLTKSPYYKNFLEKDIDEFPLIDKSTFMEKFDEINTCGIKLSDAYSTAIKAEKTRNFSPTINGITIGLSSGTTGNRGIFMASEDERARWVACVLDRVIGFSLRKRKVAFFLRANSNLYSSVQSSILEFYFFDLLKEVNENIKKLGLLKPTILVAQPSMLVEIAKAVENNALNISPKKIISVAEVLSPEDKNYLTKVFGQTIHQVYQCTEGFLAATCKEGVMHFNEDFLIIEKKYVDEEKRRFHPVITDLMRRTQPVIRYELNDIIIEKKGCTCGSQWMAIEQIEGRSDDVLVFDSIHQKEVKIFPDFFRRAIITSDETIRDYALKQTAKKSLELFIHSPNDNSYSKAEESIQHLLSHYEVDGVRIEKVLQSKRSFANKLRRIKNDSRKEN